MMLNEGLSELAAIKIMCDRVDLPPSLGYRIMLFATRAARITQRPVDMVDVARAIKYASENKHRLIGH